MSVSEETSRSNVQSVSEETSMSNVQSVSTQMYLCDSSTTQETQWEVPKCRSVNRIPSQTLISRVYLCMSLQCMWILPAMSSLF